MRIVVGLSGASGVIYGIRLLEVLREVGVETHLVISPLARRTIQLETDYSTAQVTALASHVHAFGDLAAPIASGSFQTDGMAVVPCSIKTLSAIANCYTENLLVRAADVTLKERRRLVLVPRETPLHLGHLRLMQQAAEMGAVLLPPMPAFYSRPKTLADLINHLAGRVCDLMGIETRGLVQRWEGPPPAED